MNSLLDDDDDGSASANHREVTLGTGTILALFVGLALLCGAFFGFGYKMGRPRTIGPMQAAAADTVTAPNATFNNFKPAAGSPAGGTAAATPLRTPVAAPAASKPATAPAEPEVSPPPPPTHSIAAVPNRPASDAVAPVSSTVAPGSFVVQVAAFTHQEDADLLVHALKVKGYPAFARAEPQDKLQHIQVGPFANRKDAEAAKQRLLSDGYQPILK